MRTIDAREGIRITQTSTTASLLAKVLWITTVGFLITAFGAWIAPESLGVGFLGVAILSFGLIFAISYASRRSPGLALGLFYVFTLVEGVLIGPMLQMYLHMANGQNIVFEAAATTAVGMAVMAAIAQVAQFDYRRVSGYLYGALIGLVVIGVVSMFVSFVSPGLYAWAGLVIFGGLLLVDFMRLRDSPAVTSPVLLAVSIYLDALNIFLFLLQIFGGGNRRRS